MTEKVLSGIRIIDVSTFQAAPFCCQLLADFGAEVIRVEPPGGSIDRELGPFHQNGKNLAVNLYNRNKKGITLNLNSEKGKAAFFDLIKVSDVFVSNLTPRAIKKLGIGYDVLKPINPGLIFASVTAYGSTGPYTERPGFDPVIQALIGHMYITGFPDTAPTKSGSSYIDFGTGLYAALGIMIALRHKDKTKEGQFIDVSLLDTGVSFMEAVYMQYKVLNTVQPRMGNARPFSAPTDALKCKDGYIYLAVTFDRMWKKLLKLIGREDLVNDTRFANSEGRRINRDYLNSLTEGWLSSKTREEAASELVGVGIPAAPVNTITEAIEDSQIKARELLVDVNHPGFGNLPLYGVIPKLSNTSGSIDFPAPDVGQHNEEVYSKLLSYEDDKIEALKKEGII